MHFGFSLAQNLCGGDESVDVDETVEGMARAVAEAIAETSVECSGTGNAEGSGEAIARASAKAQATARAIVQGWVGAETCTGCTVATDLLASATETVFLEAIAESESQVRASSPCLFGFVVHPAVPLGMYPTGHAPFEC